MRLQRIGLAGAGVIVGYLGFALSAYPSANKMHVDLVHAVRYLLMGGGAAPLIIAFSARLRERLRSGWRWGALRLSLPIIAVAVVLVLFESTLQWWTGDLWVLT